MLKRWQTRQEFLLQESRSGKTRTARAATLEALAKALSVPVEFFTKEINDHLFDNGGDDLAVLEKTYGPSVRSSLQFGDYRTLWLAYDTVSTSRYEFQNVFANITDRDPKLSPAFKKLRSHIEQINVELQKDPSKGKPFFDGPTVCLSRYNLNHTADGHEHKILSVDFARSRYANNVTAKSGTAANLRKRELSKFNFLEQPIEWLASGVGVAIVVFCEDGKRFITARRSEHERFRSLEFDISVVEGINPVKDRSLSEPNRIYVHEVAKRALLAELGIQVPLEDIFVFGFGVDLEYYQWNFLAYANVDMTFQEAKDHWQHADEKFEFLELDAELATPEAAASYCALRPIWSSGMAALYFSLIKRSEDPQRVHRAFAQAFKGAVNS